jgi:hypothetical protein
VSNTVPQRAGERGMRNDQYACHESLEDPDTVPSTQLYSRWSRDPDDGRVSRN